jgi:hypothetical protein
LARFKIIKKAKITYDSLLSIKQGPCESTQMYINKFVESAYRISDFDDKILVLALRKGLLKSQLCFEGKEDAYSSKEDRR